MIVRVLPRAQADLLEIEAWLRRECAERWERTLDKLLAGLAQLSRFPASGAVARDPVLKRRGYRALVRDRYVVFYKVERSTVFIYRVLHQRQSWSRLL